MPKFHDEKAQQRRALCRQDISGGSIEHSHMHQRLVAGTPPPVILAAAIIQFSLQASVSSRTRIAGGRCRVVSNSLGGGDESL